MKRSLHTVWLLVVGMFVSFTLQTWAIEHTKDSLETVRKNLKEGKAILLDVRTPEEWNEGHLQAAQLFPLQQLQTQGVPENRWDKSKIIYCHCRSGRRALAAAEILAKAGYDVRPLKQGYEELVKAGFPPAASPDKGQKDQPPQSKP
jgi:phage shock protein E